MVSGKSEVTKKDFAGFMALATFSLLGNDPLHIFKTSSKDTSTIDVEFFKKCEKEIGDKSEAEIAAMEYEMLIFLMFTVTQVARGNKIDDEVLNDYHAKVVSHLVPEIIWDYDGISEFEKRLKKRYEEYYKALENEAGFGPFFHLGDAVIKNIFGTEDDDLVFVGSILLANLSTNYIKGIKEKLIDRYQII